MERNCANGAMQLDIDEMILDYLIFSATKKILGDYERRGELPDNTDTDSEADVFLQLVNSFLSMFRHMHVDEYGNSELKFSLRLLKFTVMFANRNALRNMTSSASTLHMLQHKRRAQANAFRCNNEILVRSNLPDPNTCFAPLDPVKIKEEQIIKNPTLAPRNLQNIHKSKLPSFSLLDTLPLFMALSASQNAMQETTITQTWMQLAAGYMAQAVIEQYLVYDSRRADLIQQSFAWGFDAGCRAEEGSDEWQVNAMFWDEDGAVPDWDPIRDEHVRALIPPKGIDLIEHLQTLTVGELSMRQFEKHVMEFLTKVHQGRPRPLLTQLELGEVEGLSQRGVQALCETIGTA